MFFLLPSADCLLPRRRLSALRVPASPCPRVAVSRSPSPVNGQPFAIRNSPFAIRNVSPAAFCLLRCRPLTFHVSLFTSHVPCRLTFHSSRFTFPCRLTFHVSRLTFPCRLTFHVSRFIFHVSRSLAPSRLTSHVSLFTSHVPLPSHVSRFTFHFSRFTIRSLVPLSPRMSKSTSSTTSPINQPNVSRTATPANTLGEVV